MVDEKIYKALVSLVDLRQMVLPFDAVGKPTMLLPLEAVGELAKPATTAR
jgi:hypothetical protein